MIEAVSIQGVTLPAAYTARAASLDDVDAITALSHAVSLDQFGTVEPPAGQIRSVLEMPGFNPAESTRVVFTPEGKLIGYVDILDTLREPIRMRATLRVHPDYLDTEVGLWLMQWAEERGHLAVEKCPPGVMVAFYVGCKTGYQPMESLLEQMQMEPVRQFLTMYIEMKEPPPQPIFPEGITIRAYRHDEDLEAMLQADEAVFMDHWGFFKIPMEENIERWRHRIESRDDFDEKLWVLAIDDATGEIAGLCLNFMTWNSNPEVAFVDTVGVRREWRRKGLGLALMYQAFNLFWQRGRTKVALGVDGESLTGATRLYEKAGMHIYRRVSLYQKIIRDGIDTTIVSLDK